MYQRLLETGDILLSITVPGGLRKRWDSPIQKLYAKEFELKTFQINPSIAYKLSNNLSIALGANIVYSEGTVYSDGSDVNLPIKREMKGDSIDFGFNGAISLHLDKGWNIALTYRSKIKLTESGKANLYLGAVGRKYDAWVNIYLPATLTFAVSKEFEKLSLEVVYERTFWSSYKELDFSYSPSLTSSVLKSLFDEPIKKNWKDTNTFRVGIRYKYSEKLTLMAGYSYDETPIKEEYLSYELPDSNAHIFSAGFKYNYNKNLTFGAALLYDYKKKRRVHNDIIDGEFSKGGAFLFTAGIEYRF